MLPITSNTASTSRTARRSARHRTPSGLLRHQQGQDRRRRHGRGQAELGHQRHRRDRFADAARGLHLARAKTWTSRSLARLCTAASTAAGRKPTCWRSTAAEDMKTSSIALRCQLRHRASGSRWPTYLDYSGDGFLIDSRSWYVAGGCRIGKFTPYAIYAETKADIEDETNGGFLNGGINATLYSANATQKTTSVGLRFDAYKNIAIKAAVRPPANRRQVQWPLQGAHRQRLPDRQQRRHRDGRCRLRVLRRPP